MVKSKKVAIERGGLIKGRIGSLEVLVAPDLIEEIETEGILHELWKDMDSAQALALFEHIRGPFAVHEIIRSVRSGTAKGTSRSEILSRVWTEIERGTSFAPDVTLPSIHIAAIVIPKGRVHQGTLVASHSALWLEIVRRLGKDWRLAYELTPTQWEELIAGAYSKAGFDEVILTPRSRDFGRDIIATKRGVGSVQIINSVKAFGPADVAPLA